MTDSDPFQILGCRLGLPSKVDVDRSAAKNEETAEVIASAADGLGGARVASDADDGKRAAAEANLSSDAAEKDTKETGKGAGNGVADRLNGVAALDGPSGALVAGSNGGRTGGRAEGEDEEQEEGGDARKHCELTAFLYLSDVQFGLRPRSPCRFTFTPDPGSDA